LDGLVDTLNNVYQTNPNKAPKIVFVTKGTFHGNNNSSVNINYPLIMIGAGQNKTFLSGYSLCIGGTQEEEKRVGMQGMTIKGSRVNGLFGNNGLSFLCDSMTFTECGQCGVFAYDTQGRFINCVVTQCGWSGIHCGRNALIELEGDQTKVDGNGTGGYGYYGLHASDPSSIIHLLFPLTKESVSTNNGGGGNYGGGNGEIAIVDSDGNIIEVINEAHEYDY
jgi:hypothetical protein